MAAATGTLYLNGLKQNTGLREAREVANTAAGVAALLAGEVKGYMTNAAQMLYYFSVGQYPDVKLVEDWEPTFHSVGGIAVRKDDTELLGKINAGLANLTADGTLARLAAKWSVLPPA